MQTKGFHNRIRQARVRDVWGWEIGPSNGESNRKEHEKSMETKMIVHGDLGFRGQEGAYYIALALSITVTLRRGL